METATERQDAKRAKTEHQAAEGAEPMAVDDAVQQKDAAAPEQQQQTGPSMRFLMTQYYKRLFPVQQMFKWLCYGNDSSHAAADGSFSSRRELCFTLEGDIFVRYQSYKSWTDLATDLARKVPSKIDIGPVYTHDPRQRAKYAKDFKPVQRELVIDIDMTDYDELRTCGSGGHICSRCWPFIAVAIQVLDTALREDFGFQHILWVYSGRRGVHCWVADEGARLLADDVRASVVGYLSVIRGVEGGMAKLGMGMVKHPALERAERLLRSAWRQHLLPEQCLLDEPQHYNALLQYIPDEELRSSLAAKWAKGGQGIVPGGNRRASAAAAAAAGDSVSLSVRRWDELEKAVKEQASRLPSGKAAKALEKTLDDIIFAYSYPRLDVEVTKKMNHLLKAPFCVHPKTGKVCVPIDPEAAWDFDPDDVPTVQQLVQEINEQQQDAGASPQQQQAAGAEGWRGTSLEPYIAAFASSFLSPLAASSKAALNERAQAAAAEQRTQRADVSW
ncbi:hypothetical protein OEZ86_005973 [Tetradesmus obliquus]|nr:hypothetical protein OEZ86_005973 [Tetradesmus obliquus]